jgi:hypothetical protein
MKNKTITILALTAILSLILIPAALAAINVPLPNDLPPGAMSYGNVSSGKLPFDPNIIAAVIGVVGLLVGSIITIFATYFIRWMDMRREDKRERHLMEKDRKEKTFQMKQEVYKNFLNELSNLESFIQADLETFKRDLIKTDMKLDLVAPDEIRDTNETLKNMLLAIAEKNYKNKSIALTDEYLLNRETLLKAIRKDIDLQNK